MNTAPDPLRILQLSTERGWRGGERQVWLLSRELQRKGHQVQVACPLQSPLQTRCQEEGLATIDLAPCCDLDLRAAFRLAGWMRAQPVDVIHAQSGRAHSMALLAQALSPSHSALVVSRRVAFPIKRSGANRLKYRHADAYLPISQAAANDLQAIGVPPDHIHIVWGAIQPHYPDPESITTLRQELQLEPNSRVIGTVGYCDAVKNQRALVEAAPAIIAQEPAAVFIIVGDGPERPALLERAQQLGVERHFRFAGFRNDVDRFFALFDLFVLTSTHEGMCTSLMDAQAHGVPCIATRVGGVPEVLRDQETGLLVAPDDQPALIEAMLKLLGDANLRRKQGEQGKQHIAQHFSITRMANDTLSVYQQVCQRKKTGP